jgi:hypothetical protein
MASLVERDPSLRERVPIDPLSYIERLFFDTALSFNRPAFASEGPPHGQG